MNNSINRDGQEITIDLLEVVKTLWRHKWAIILTTLIACGLVGAFTYFFITPKYTSTTSMYVFVQAKDTNVNNVSVSKGLAKDSVELGTSQSVLAEAINSTGYDITNEQLKKMVSVTVPTDTSVIKVSVTNPEPEVARRLANAIREALAEQLVSVVKVDSANTVDEANLPTTPSSPVLWKNALIGAAVGFILSTILVILATMYDDTIKTVDDIEDGLGLPVIGVIPIEEGQEARVKKERKAAKRGKNKK